MSYADMVTLLFALFLVLFASSMEKGQLQEVIGKVSAQLGAAPSPSPSPLPVTPTTPAPTPDSRQLLREQLQRALGSDLGSAASLHEERRGLVVAVLDSPMLFSSGSTKLQPAAQALIRRVVEVARPLPHFVRVEGHTDNVPVGNSGFRSNWELSVLRAAAVAEEAIAVGLPPERLSVMGYGQTQPRYPNANPIDRARNRRVEIIFLDPVKPVASAAETDFNPEKADPTWSEVLDSVTHNFSQNQ